MTLLVIPGRPEGPGPESIITTLSMTHCRCTSSPFVIMDSGLATSSRPGMTSGGEA